MELTRAEEQVENFIQRYNDNLNRERVDNGSLRAGSPMYYYCKTCGEEIVLPEEHTCPAPKLCDGCVELEKHELLGEALRRVGRA